MESIRGNEFAENRSNVVSLDEQRKLRQQQKQAATEEVSEAESISEARCENGDCSLQWRPKRRTA